MHNSDHVEVALNKIRTLFEKASERIEALNPGEKVPATALAEQIGEQFGLTGPQLYPTLRFLFDGYPGILVRRGAHGGLIKPSLTDNKNSKKTEVVTNTDEVSSSEDSNV